MDWRLVGRMGIVGLPLGLLSVAGWLPFRFEPYIWVAIAFMWVTVAIRKAPDGPFRLVMAASLMASFLHADIQAILWNTYVDNNPHIAEQVALAEPNAPLRTANVIAGFARGLLFGALGGVAAVVALRFSGHRNDDAAADAPVAITGTDSEE